MPQAESFSPYAIRPLSRTMPHPPGPTVLRPALLEGDLPMFVHAVYFWMKPGATAEQTAQLANDAKAYLGKIPEVRHIWVGKPAMTPREVVDNSYDVGLLVCLDDVKGHDAYQVAPLHLEFIARNKANWDRVKIYDFID
jgi:hypothetical protein